ncbi:MAG: FecR domain-containing protein [Alphaproteobacteria bacterium]
MTTSPQSDRERAEDEAATWLVLLSDAPDDAALRARFDAWHAASDLNAEIWARTSRAYDLVGKGTPRHEEHWASYAIGRDTARSLPRARRSFRGPRRQGARFWRWPVFTPWRLGVGIGAAALAALLLIVILPGVLLRMEADAVTATAELRTMTLEDGTRVQLAPESAIDVAFAADERRVRLLKGDVFFEVTPDRARPFRVVAGETLTTVLGTAFEVRRGEDGAAVTVRHGHVRVEDDSTTPRTSEELRDGDWVRVTWRGTAVRGSAQADEIADWVRGELVARDRPAGEVVAALRPYYKGAIVVRDDAFAGRHVSGIYDLRDPVKTLRDLAASHGAAVRQITPWLLVVTAE